MTPILIAITTYASLSTALAALMFGLWWGERKRCETLENLLRSGTPDHPTAAVRPAPPDVEVELGGAKTLPATMIQAVADGIIAVAQGEGRTISPTEAYREAESMLQDQGTAAALFEPRG